MAVKHIFISHSSKDKEAADRLCRALEQRGLRCWIAPRDVTPGSYAASIIRAIRGAGGLLLLSTENALASEHVRRELDRAASGGVPIVPLRLDDARPPEQIEYYLAGMHWLDLREGDLDQHLQSLHDRLLPLGQTPLPAEAPPSQVAGGRIRLARLRGLAGLLDRLLDLVCATSPPLLAFGLALIGLLMVSASLLLGFGDFEYTLMVDGATVTKQVGFLYALNWSIGFLVVYPAIAFVGVQSVRELGNLANQLSQRRMVIDGDFRLADPALVERSLRRVLRAAVATSLLLLAICVGYALWEFQAVVGRHYDTGLPFPEIALDDPYQERDWSVAALLPAADGSPPERSANYFFGLVAYVLLVGLGSAIVFSTFVSLLAVAAFAYGLSGRRGQLALVPDLRLPNRRDSFDSRCGFQAFEGLFKKALLVVLLGFLGLYFVHLQNLYMRSPAPDLMTFLLPDLAGHGLVSAFAMGDSPDSPQALANLSSAIAYGFGTLLFASVVIVLSMTLRLSGRQAHDRMVERIDNEEKPLPEWVDDVPRETLQDRLDTMRFWPVRWPRVNQLIVAIALAFGCFILFRVGFLLILAGLLFAISRMFEREERRPRAGRSRA